MAELALVVLAIAFFAPAIFLGQVPLYRDFGNVFLPYKLYAARALADGRFPLWSPEQALGAPFHASDQAGLLYPPSAIVFLSPNAAGIGFFLAFHAWIGAYGMECLLARRQLAPPARLMGAVVYAFGGVFVSVLPWPHAVVLAWMPLAVVAVEAAIAAPSQRRVLALVAVVALQALGGAPESFAQSAVLVTVAALAAPGSVSLGRRFVLACIPILLALAIAGAQIAPTAELVIESERLGGMATDVVGRFSLEPASFSTLLHPHRLDGGIVAPIPEQQFPLFWSMYIGLAPLLLAVIAMPSRGGRPFMLLLLLAFALALGEHGPIFGRLHAAAPTLVGLFRYPEKFLVSAHFALAVLAALGLDVAMRVIRLRTRLDERAIGYGLCLLAIADLWTVHQPALVFMHLDALLRSAPPAELEPIGPETRIFHYQREASSLATWYPTFTIGGDLREFKRRVWSDLGANAGFVYGAGFVADAAGLRRRPSAELLHFVNHAPVERSLHALAALGVHFLVGPDSIESGGVDLLRRGGAGRGFIYRLSHGSPRFYLASRVRAAAGLPQALEQMADPSFAPGVDATLERDCPAIPACGRGARSAGAGGAVEAIELAPERIAFEVTAAEPTLLVVNDSAYPGWRARIDDVEVPILVANGLVRGIVVPSGRHRVTLRYEPASFMLGLALSAVGLLGALAFARSAAPRVERSA